MQNAFVVLCWLERTYFRVQPAGGVKYRVEFVGGTIVIPHPKKVIVTFAMAENQKFKAAFPYQQDVLALPVADLDVASKWYSEHFGMFEVERHSSPCPAVILERDGTRIGFSVNGGDPSQDGAAILVSNIKGIKEELESRGVVVGNWRTDERNGEKLQVFFVVAPDGLCFYFHEPVQS